VAHSDGDRVALTFPVLVREDLVSVDQWAESLAERVVRCLGDMWDSLRGRVGELSASAVHTPEELLYHVVGCYTLDWKALKRGTDAGLMVLGKEQPGDRNYILTGFEEVEGRAQQEARLLCSSQLPDLAKDLEA